MDRWIKPLNSPPQLSGTDLLSAEARIVLMSLERRYGVKDSFWSFSNSEACSYNAGNCELQDRQCSLLGSSIKVKQEHITPISSAECLNYQNVAVPRQNVNTGGDACLMQSENRLNKVRRKDAGSLETEPVAIKVVKMAPSCDPTTPNCLVGVLQTNKVQNKDGHQDHNNISLAFPSIDSTRTYDSQSTKLNMTTYAIKTCYGVSPVQQRSLACLDNNADIVNRESLKSVNITSTPKTAKPDYNTHSLSNHGHSTNNQSMGSYLKSSCRQLSKEIQDSYSINAPLKENKDYHKTQKQVVNLPVAAPSTSVSVTKRATSAVYSSEAHIQQFLHQHVDQHEKRRELEASHVNCIKNLSRATNGKSEDELRANIPSSSHNAKTRGDDQLLIDITSLSPQEREIVSSQLETVGEVCLMVVYHDNSTSASLSFCQLNDRIGQLAKGVLVYAENRMMLFPLVVSDPSLVKWCRSLLNALLCKETIRKVVVNSKQLVKVLVQKLNFTRQSGVMLWHLEDPAVAGWLLNPDDPPCSLKDLRKKSEKDTSFCEDNYNYYRTKPDSKFYFLAKELLAIMEGQRILLKSYGLWQLFLHVEMPLVPVLALMELQPIRVDMPTLLRYSDILKKNLQKLESQAHELATHPFSINSTSQLRQVLYEELGLDKQMSCGNGMIPTTSNNLKSTSEAVLAQMSAYHPLPSVILQYRQLAKMKSTYIEGILELVQDGVVYTHWDQTAAATGRLTSCNPNLQAVPKTSMVIKDVDNSIIIGSEPKIVKICAREPYICGENNVFLAADFQQIELRLLAHLTDDITLRTIFNSLSHFDVFIQLSAKWLSKAESKVTNMEREQTKRVVYSIMYGVGKERLAQYLKVTPSTAKEIINSFLVSFPAIQHFTQWCITFARQHGYAETLMGRKRWLPNITHSAAQLRAQAERQAVNFCVQGSAADLCKCTMLRVEEVLHNKSHLRARLLLQIHDELVWELPSDQLQETCEVIKKVMEDASLLCSPFVPGLKVPLSVHLTHGTSWARLSPQILRPPDVAAFSVSNSCAT